MERTLGVDALIDIARRYYDRTDSNSQIADDYGFSRRYVPRLARAGKLLRKNQKAPAGETARGTDQIHESRSGCLTVPILHQGSPTAESLGTENQ